MKKILVNLKDWLDYYQNIDFALQIDGLDITVFPSLPYLYIYKDINVKIGSQKISSYDEGPHTGSISAKHLKDFKVTSVILNHRECKISDTKNLCQKIKNAQKEHMDVIICIDSYYEDELNKIKNVLDQVETTNISIAYEPNEELDLDHIAENLKIIKEHLKTYSLSYIYGNNVTADNILTYSKKLDIDGFLISSHALNIEGLKKMVKLVKSEG